MKNGMIDGLQQTRPPHCYKCFRETRPAVHGGTLCNGCEHFEENCICEELK